MYQRINKDKSEDMIYLLYCKLFSKWDAMAKFGKVKRWEELRRKERERERERGKRRGVPPSPLIAWVSTNEL